MDQTQFERLTRVLSDLTDRLPRRGVLGLLAALTAARVVGSPEAGFAKPKRRKKCPTGQQRCARGKGQPCVGCCTDADCGGNACLGGACAACPTGQRSCRGGCIALDACCVDGECAGNRVCTGGACECAPSDRLCEGVCISRRECCGTDCPPNGGGGGGGGGGTPQVCTPETCNGCCDGTQCREGVTANNCGRGGVACTPCSSGESCDAGVCVGGSGTCTADTCGGCCDAQGECRAGEGQNFCGRNGTACTQCGRDAFCNAGRCDCPPETRMCPNGDCIFESNRECCDNSDCRAVDGSLGLCRPDHVCAYRPLCGGTDRTCSEFCCSGQCDTADNTCAQSSLGQPCANDNDCEAGLSCQFFVCEP